jgi:pimeloyl-ACP methyl ester carboxylesterase
VRLAWTLLEGMGPTVVFLPGFRSDMMGAKAVAVAEWCRAQGRACLRLDYSGHGASEGVFTEGTIGRWTADALAVVDAVTDGPLVLVGSSMGGWIMLQVALQRPPRVVGLVGVAAAPDFTEALMWQSMMPAERAVLERDGVLMVPSAYGEPTPVTKALIEDGRRHLLMGGPIGLACPARLLHGQRDPDVPWETSVRLAERLAGDDVQVVLVKDGDHRLSRDSDIALLLGLVAGVALQAFAIAGVSPRDTQPRLRLLRRDAAVLGPEAPAHGRHRGQRLVERHERRFRRAEQRRGMGGDLGVGGGFVVVQVQDPWAGQALLAHGGQHGARDVVAVDAAEQMAGLVDPPGAARADVIEDGAAGAVDAGDAEQVDAGLRESAGPGLFGLQPALAAGSGGCGRGVLVHPGTAAVAVDAGGRQHAGPFGAAQMAGEAMERRIAVLAGWRGLQQMAGGLQHRAGRVEGDELHAGRRRERGRVPAGGGDAVAFGCGAACNLGAGVAEAEDEEVMSVHAPY